MEKVHFGQKRGDRRDKVQEETALRREHTAEEGMMGEESGQKSRKFHLMKKEGRERRDQRGQRQGERGRVGSGLGSKGIH